MMCSPAGAIHSAAFVLGGVPRPAEGLSARCNVPQDRPDLVPVLGACLIGVHDTSVKAGPPARVTAPISFHDPLHDASASSFLDQTGSAVIRSRVRSVLAGGRIAEEGVAMTHSSSAPDAVRMARARRVLESLARRVTEDEAVGVLGCWWHCSSGQARAELHARYGPPGGDADLEPGASRGVHAEATRIVAVTNAAADGRADPEFGER